MASIKGVSLKKIRKTEGREGIGYQADIYLNNKKIGNVVEWADGGKAEVNIPSKENMETLMHIVYEWGDKNPSDYIVSLYTQEPNRLQQEIERVKKHYPYIREDEMTINALSVNDPAIFLETVVNLAEIEKVFKSAVKKGYECIALCKNGDCIQFMKAGIDSVMKDYEIERVFNSLDDFTS